jgi:hypothetical protein
MILTRASTAKRIAAKSIHRSKWRQPHGLQAANSIGGSKNGKSGGAGCAARTVANDGSKLLIFVVPRVDWPWLVVALVGVGAPHTFHFFDRFRLLRRNELSP